MKYPAAQRTDAAVAGLYSIGDRHSLVVLRRAGEGWAIAEVRTLNAAELPSVAETCQRHGVDRVTRIAPALECVSKTIDVPVGEPAQMAAAAGLLAEAELPPSLPAHRRAGMLIPDTSRHGVCTALLTGWLTRREPPPPLAGVDESWACPASSLAVLRGDGRFAMFAEPREGAVITIATGHEHAAARVVPAPAGNAAGWQEAKRDAAIETAARIGMNPSEIPSGGAVTLPKQSRERLCMISGVRDDPNWFDEYGMALGAALLAGDGQHGVLAGLSARAPVVKRSPVLRAAEWVSDPKRAVWTAVAACGVMLLLPWGFAWARHEVLTKRTSVLEQMKGTKAEIEKKAALYNQLDISRWPMTKLLADLSGATPVGIIATDVRLSPEQGLSFQGTAEKSDLISTFQGNLSKTRLFRNVKIARVESKPDAGVEFSLTAEVPSGMGHTPVTPAEDFAARSLSVRMHGVEAGPRHTADAATRDSSRTVRRTARNGDGAAADSDSTADRRPSSSEAPPPVVSDAEIEKMDLSTANKGWIARKVYVQKNPTLDAETKQRLQDEETRIRTHAEKLRNSPQAGGAPK